MNERTEQTEQKQIIPDETRRGFIDDPTLAAEVYYDTPRGLPASFRPDTAEEAAREPGCAVKSVARSDAPGAGFPKHFGRLAEYSPERVVVLGLVFYTPTFVWIGTQPEYESVWMCD